MSESSFFVRWNSKADNTGTAIDPQTATFADYAALAVVETEGSNIGKGTITLYAYYAGALYNLKLVVGTDYGSDIEVGKVSLLYNPNDCDDIKGIYSKNYNDNVTEQMYLQGWYAKDAEGNDVEYVQGESTLAEYADADGNVTLYAKWDTKYTLTLNAGSADSNNENQKVESETYYFIESQFDTALDNFDAASAEQFNEDLKVSKYFAGWSISEVNVDLFTNKIASFDATWDDKVKLTINYNNSEFTPTVDDRKIWLTHGTYTYDAENNIKANDDKEDKSMYFNGWSAEHCTVTVEEDGTFMVEVDETAKEASIEVEWKNKYKVTYDANGGTCETQQNWGYENSSVTLPTPTRTGYKFAGWYTEPSDGTKIIGTTYTPNTNITMYAHWEAISYTITQDTVSNATITGLPKTAYYNEQVTVTVTFTQTNSQTVTVMNVTTNEKVVCTKSETEENTYTFTMPASNVTISASSEEKSNGCVAPGTLITLADGTQKKVEDVTYDDMLLVWDFNTGTYVAKTAAILINMGEGYYSVVNLNFSDGTTIKMLDIHGFFDLNENKYVFINAANVADYVGHCFVKATDTGNKEVILTSYSITNEYTTAYSILSAENYNVFTEGILTVTPLPGIDNNAFYACWVFGDDLTYDKEAMQNLIDKHGLFTYEDFVEYGVTYEQFIGANLAYVKVLIGEGAITMEEALQIMADFLPSP